MNIIVEKVALKSVTEIGLGLVANEMLQTKFPVVRVPFRAMMSLNSMRKSGDFKAALEADPLIRDMPNIALSLHVLNEKLKGQESQWKAYIDVLPAAYTTPLYFNAEDIQLLRPSFYFEESLKMWRNIARQFAYFCQILANENNVLSKTCFTLRNFTFDSYRWATATVMTRLNLVPDYHIDEYHALKPTLIPLLDMANHDATLGPSLDFDEGVESAVLYAARDYEPGQEVRVFYGHRTDGEFLLHNGFIGDTPNDLDHLVLKLGLAKSDKLMDAKLDLLKQLLPSDEHFIIRPSRVSDDLLHLFTFAVIFQADTSQKLAIFQENLHNKSINLSTLFDTLSVETQNSAKCFVQTRLRLLLRAYEQVPFPTMTSINSKLIAKLLHTERRILKFALGNIVV